MYFRKFISVLFTLALFALEISAAPSSSERKWYRRVTKANCRRQALSERSIQKRDFVPEDDAKRRSSRHTLETGGLSTCMGMAVVDWPTPARGHHAVVTQHFMAHIIVGESAGFDKLKDLMTEHRTSSSHYYGYVTVPAINSDNARELLEESLDEGDSPVTERHVTGYMEYLNDWYVGKQNSLNSRAPIIGYAFHDPMTINTMQSLGNGVVTVNGQVISTTP
jgi:hypothetical protein